MSIMIDTGNYIAAKAAVMAKPDVVAAYPITPQTTLVEGIANYLKSGEFQGEYICVESEHSAMSACIGASAAGSRTFTATSAHGLLLMHEMLHWAALARLPVVMCNINRVIGPGWNIWTDENDSISQRDTGWIQFYCSSNQEIFDTIIQAFRIAENPDILLPVMISYNAFILSHTSMPVEIPSQAKIDAFVSKYTPGWKLDTNNPISHGNIIGTLHYEKIRRDMQRSQDHAKRYIKTIAQEWKTLFGRFHGDLLEKYECENAEYIIISMGAIGAESKEAVDNLRSQGLKIGLARLRVLRPFPKKEVIALAKQAELIIIDRNISIGSEGVVSNEVKAALFNSDHKKITSYIAGLGGKDVPYTDIQKMVSTAIKKDYTQPVWFGFPEEVPK